MMIQRLEMCIQFIRLALEFVIIVAEAVGFVIEQNTSHQLSSQHFPAPAPFVGILP
ncbi:uncharacterized protein LOC110634991 [Hevea brasiliensis]|uniref:uncharacterized protein LOC110634991 n=1 Tax=Hevea brasiliensis TaxID=3981 RepID=UPI000B78AD16|nr:uncharacterized protein LOC110634991 [Hevea brasiliensis]XP_057992921.1 uncharacterized protein LOC110634991 [Hevea brasiliensis]